MEKMLVTQAFDERDYEVKKIGDKNREIRLGDNMKKLFLELYFSVDDIIRVEVIRIMLIHSHDECFRKLIEDARRGELELESMIAALEERIEKADESDNDAGK